MNSSGRSNVNRSAWSRGVHGHGTGMHAPASRRCRLLPLNQKTELGLRAARVRAETVLLQTASLIAAAMRPPTYTGSAESSRCASWTMPAGGPG